MGEHVSDEKLLHNAVLGTTESFMSLYRQLEYENRNPILWLEVITRLLKELSQQTGDTANTKIAMLLRLLAGRLPELPESCNQKLYLLKGVLEEKTSLPDLRSPLLETINSKLTHYRVPEVTPPDQVTPAQRRRNPRLSLDSTAGPALLADIRKLLEQAKTDAAHISTLKGQASEDATQTSKHVTAAKASVSEIESLKKTVVGIVSTMHNNLQYTVCLYATNLLEVADSYFYGYKKPVDREKAKELYTCLRDYADKSEIREYVTQRLAELQYTPNTHELDTQLSSAQGLHKAEKYKEARPNFEFVAALEKDVAKKAIAFLELARLYMGGQGVPKDLSKAQMFLTLASQQRANMKVRLQGCALLASLYYKNEEYELAYDSYKTVFGHEKESESIDYCSAACYLGILSYLGKGSMTKDPNAAENYLKIVLDKSTEPVLRALAAAYLGDLYTYSSETQKYSIAEKLLQEAATQNISQEASMIAHRALHHRTKKPMSLLNWIFSWFTSTR